MVLAVKNIRNGWEARETEGRRKKIFWEQRPKVNMWLLPEQNKNSQRFSNENPGSGNQKGTVYFGVREDMLSHSGPPSPEHTVTASPLPRLYPHIPLCRPEKQPA